MQPTNLVLYFCHALQNDQWQKISVETKVYTRDEAIKLVNEQIGNLGQKLPTEEHTKLQAAAGDLKTNGQLISQTLLAQHLKEKGLPIGSQREQNLIDAYQRRLTVSPENLPKLEDLEIAIQAQNYWQNNFGQKVAATVTQNLASGYSPALKQQRIREISQQVETIVGRQLQAGKPLDENFTRSVYQTVSRPLAWQAAIANPRQFQQGLGETIAGAASQKDSLTRSYNNLRNFQMTVNPSYWQIAQWLNEKKLSVPETERIINFIQQNVGLGNSSWEIEHQLRTVLKRYPQTADSAAILAQRTGLYLSRTTPASPQIKKLAQKIKTPNLSAVQQTVKKRDEDWQRLDKKPAKITQATFVGAFSRWVSQPYNKALGQFGNWLESKGLHYAAAAVWGNPLLGKAGGLKALAGHLFSKIGGGKLLAIAAGPVGTALAGLAAVLQNRQLRDLAGMVLTGIIYLFIKIPLAIVFSIGGFLIGGPLGAAIGFGAGLLLQNISNSLGGISQTAGAALAKSAPALQTAAGLPAAASNLPVTGLTAVSIFAPLGSVVFFTLLASMSLTSALSLPPQTGTGGGVDQVFPPRELPATASCGLACDLARILNKPHCGAGQVTSGTLNPALACIMNDPGLNIDSPARQLVADEIQRSVNGLGTLHCVGFKKAVEPALRSYDQNAVAFIYNHPGSTVTSPQVGDNAVWGPRASCKDSAGKTVTDPQQANALCGGNLLACCGHIGIVSQITDTEIGISSAWGGAGTVNTIYLPISATKEDGRPWIFFRP